MIVPSEITVSFPRGIFNNFKNAVSKNILFILLSCFMFISLFTFITFYLDGLGLAYNDARSHLNIGRRVVEGLKTGIAQLGSVWLPLPHVLMIPTVWNDFMWHSGLSGAIQSMLSFIATAVMIFYLVKKFGGSTQGAIVGTMVFVFNLNILYLQSTAMTELLLLATMTASVFKLIDWFKSDSIFDLILCAFFVMLATLVRYDGWFLLFYSTMLVAIESIRKGTYKDAEGKTILFCTLAGLGIVLWFLWNLLIFGDPLYFAFGQYSAHAQQAQLEQAGVLVTKSNIFLSSKLYFYALAYNTGLFSLVLAAAGSVILLFDKKIPGNIRFASTALYAPLIFNVIALYLGHSVLFIQGLSGDTWFNVRYGVMMMPSAAIYVGYLWGKIGKFKPLLIGFLILHIILMFGNLDAVTIDDARVGSSQKNVSQVSDWLKENAANEKGFILISAASHDAIIFSSEIPMKRFIHEGTDEYWKSATSTPDRWARWIIMRTNDVNDLTFKSIYNTPGYKRYTKVHSYPFADIYELKPEYVPFLNTEPILLNNK